MSKYVMELIGTFFLVLTIGMSVIAGGSGVIPPLAIGSILMVMIYAGGHISGGHYNPAVTLGVWLRGRCSTKDVAPYMIFQVIGALLAGFVVKYLTPGMQITTRQLAAMPELVAEFLFTFALVFVVLNSATSKDNNGNSFYGLAIDFTVLAVGICGWRRRKRRIQPRRRRGHFFHGAGLVESTMDISSGQFLWRSTCCADVQASLSGG